MQYSPLIAQLVKAFQRLPGVGPKSAQRMVLHFLEKDRDGGRQLVKALEAAIEGVGQCQRCRTLSETSVCHICVDERRDRSLLCIVETPADVFAVEQSSTYKGYYFVLMGHLSPIDGIGPDDLGIRDLLNLVLAEQISEVILATNPTVEGEATAYYIAEQLKLPELRARKLKVSRIAHGIPMGGELEYLDGGTLGHSFAGRQLISDNDAFN